MANEAQEYYLSHLENFLKLAEADTKSANKVGMCLCFDQKYIDSFTLIDPELSGRFIANFKQCIALFDGLEESQRDVFYSTYASKISYCLGQMFEANSLLQEAVQHYTKAVETANHANAAYKLSLLYREGKGCDADYHTAMSFAKIAVENGNCEPIRKFYAHSSSYSSRFHLFPAAKVDSEKRGDNLKTEILASFYFQLAATAPEQLKDKKKELEASEDFKLLARSQGFLTMILSLIGLTTTSSVAAFNNMYDEVSSRFSPS